jgi:predicted histone-like DNA-binding protein
MSIKYKTIQRGQPGVAGGGEKKYYATIVNEGEVTLDSVTKMIEKISTVSGADIRAVLYALVDIAIDNLAESRIIRFGELGSLRASLSSEGKTTEEEVSNGSIKNASVIFTPGSRLKAMLAAVKYQKV